MTLRDNHRHGRDLDICQARHWGAKVLQLAKPRDERGEPDGQLRFSIRPAFVGALGLDVDCDGLGTGLFHGDVVPTLDLRTREGLELGVGGGDLRIRFEDKSVIDDALGEGAASRDGRKGFGVDGGVLTTSGCEGQPSFSLRNEGGRESYEHPYSEMMSSV